MKMLLTVAGSSMFVFAVVGSFKNTDADASISEKTAVMGKEFAGYVGGPLVAFDRVVRHPNLVSHYPNAGAFFVESQPQRYFPI